MPGAGAQDVHRREVGAVELERGDVDPVARGLRLVRREAQLPHQVAPQPRREEAHAIQRAQGRAELRQRVAGHHARVERRAAARRAARARPPRSARDEPVRRLQQRCHSTLTASSSRVPVQRSSASSHAGPSAAHRPRTGSKPSARAPIFAASSAAPSASSAARLRKSSSDERVGSTHARMTSPSRLEAPGLHVPARRRRARAGDDEADLLGRRRPGAARRHPAASPAPARGAGSARAPAPAAPGARRRSARRDRRRSAPTR